MNLIKIVSILIVFTNFNLVNSKRLEKYTFIQNDNKDICIINETVNIKKNEVNNTTALVKYYDIEKDIKRILHCAHIDHMIVKVEKLIKLVKKLQSKRKKIFAYTGLGLIKLELVILFMMSYWTLIMIKIEIINTKKKLTNLIKKYN